MYTISLFGHSAILKKDEVRERLYNSLREIVEVQDVWLLVGSHGFGYSLRKAVNFIKWGKIRVKVCIKAGEACYKFI